jgi:hypothetical protein
MREERFLELKNKFTDIDLNDFKEIFEFVFVPEPNKDIQIEEEYVNLVVQILLPYVSNEEEAASIAFKKWKQI